VPIDQGPEGGLVTGPQAGEEGVIVVSILVQTGGALTRALALDHHHLSSSPAAPILTAGHLSAT
jgi:hypothetical protein